MKVRDSKDSLLVGDIGGTRTRLAVYDVSGRRKVEEAIFPSREHASFEDIAHPFLERCGAEPQAAVLGIAGPVRDGIAQVTNLPWTLNTRRMSKRLGIPKLVLYNDLVVAAHGCLHVPAGETIALTDARPSPRGRHLALIAAGTGLGEARLIWHETGHIAVASEGGHGDFAPQTPLEIELWHFLSARHSGHVSYERVLSGNGLGAIYDFFASRAPAVPQDIAARLADGDRNAAIAELGLARTYEPAAQAVDLFATLYGAEAGNLALRELALGGIFVTGNIGRQILPARRDLFLDGFRRKGRFTAMMESIPVAIVTDPLVGVRGALAVARRLVTPPATRRGAHR